MSQTRAFHEAPLLFPADEVPEAVLPGGRLPSYIRDHRQRLRSRFMDGGAAAVPDYELLELVLFRAIPRQDVKPLARLLLDTFGDFNRAYLIADRQGIRVLRDPYTSKPNVLFYTTKRVGGGVQDFDAIKLLKFGA